MRAVSRKEAALQHRHLSKVEAENPLSLSALDADEHTYHVYPNPDGRTWGYRMFDRFGDSIVTVLMGGSYSSALAAANHADLGVTHRREAMARQRAEQEEASHVAQEDGLCSCGADLSLERHLA